MFSKVMSAKPDLACKGRRKRKIKTGKTRIHLDAFEVVPHEFSDLKRQLPLCDVFANSLTVRRQDLAITLVKTSPSRGLAGLTFDGPILRPGN